MELRRVQGLIRRAGAKAQDAALGLATGAPYSAERDQKVLRFWQDEIRRLREEMRQLVAMEDSSSGTVPNYPAAP